MAVVSITIAFLAGLASFLSPCVLPLMPGFLAYLAGTSISKANKNRSEIFLNSLFFVLGFSIVFSILGILLNTALTQVATSLQLWLSRIGGVIIIFFGLYLTGLIKLEFLERDYKFNPTFKFKSHYITSFIFGIAFAAGWTPCVGPALGAIFGLAASNPGQAFYLLIAYALGLGVPFLILGIFTAQASVLIQKYNNVLKYFNIIFGVLLIILGILVFTQAINLIANLDFVNNILLRK